MNITKSIINENRWIVRESTLILCGEACFKNPKCSYFSFNHKTLMCYLKKAVGLIFGRIASRIKSRNWFTAAGYQWDSDCDFRGNDFITKPMSSHTYCGETCKDIQNCYYFTTTDLDPFAFSRSGLVFFLLNPKIPDAAVCGFFPSRKQFKINKT